MNPSHYTVGRQKSAPHPPFLNLKISIIFENILSHWGYLYSFRIISFYGSRQIFIIFEDNLNSESLGILVTTDDTPNHWRAFGLLDFCHITVTSWTSTNTNIFRGKPTGTAKKQAFTSPRHHYIQAVTSLLRRSARASRSIIQTAIQ